MLIEYDERTVYKITAMIFGAVWFLSHYTNGLGRINNFLSDLFQSCIFSTTSLIHNLFMSHDRVIKPLMFILSEFYIARNTNTRIQGA